MAKLNCEHCLSLLDAYLEHDLEPKARADVREHLAECAACRAERDLIEREELAYHGFAQTTEVRPELWEGVAREIAKIERKPGVGWLDGVRNWFATFVFTPRLTPVHALALVVLAVAATIFVMRSARPESSVVVNPPNSPASPPQSAPPLEPQKAEISAPSRGGAVISVDGGKYISNKGSKRPAPPIDPKNGGVKRELTTDQLIQQTEGNYIALIDRLKRPAEARKSQLDVNSQMKISGTLADIDAAIAETRKAVRKNPKDPVATQYMMEAYEKKVDVLRELAGNPKK
jgi:Putative zinc-finger